MNVDELISSRAAEMADELRSAQFEVVLIAAGEPQHSGQKLRALQFANPQWYSALCDQFTSCRGRGRKRMKRPRTYIVKTSAVAALEQIAGGRRSGVYIERMIDLIRELIARESPTAAPDLEAIEANLKAGIFF